MKLKNYIQDLIDKGDIEVDISKPSNSNNKLKMYQDPCPKHGKYKASSSHVVIYDYTNYISDFDSLVVHIEPVNTHVNTITIQGVNPPFASHRPRITIQGVDLPPIPHRPRITIQYSPPLQPSKRSSQAKIVIQGTSSSTTYPPNKCNVTNHRGRVTVQGAPPPPPQPPMSSTCSYDILDHFGKTLTQISILELLKTSPVYKEIIEQVLLESCVLDNINIAQFQSLICNLFVQHHLVFTSKDAPFDDPSHNKPFHIEAIVQNTKSRGSL